MSQCDLQPGGFAAIAEVPLRSTERRITGAMRTLIAWLRDAAQEPRFNSAIVHFRCFGDFALSQTSERSTTTSLICTTG